MLVYLFSVLSIASSLTGLLTLTLSPAADVAKYLDPGSGSFLIQLLIGGVVGLVLVVRTFWGRIKLFINNLLGRETAEIAQATDTEQDLSDDDNV
jgi:hypothetical protein